MRSENAGIAMQFGVVADLDIANATFDFHATRLTDELDIVSERGGRSSSQFFHFRVEARARYGQNSFGFFFRGSCVYLSLSLTPPSRQSARLASAAAAVLCCSFRSYLCLFPRLADIFTATKAASLLDTGTPPGERRDEEEEEVMWGAHSSREMRPDSSMGPGHCVHKN